MKILIKETFGASKTYLNQIFLSDELPKEILQDNCDKEQEENFEEQENSKKDDDILLNYLSKNKTDEKNKPYNDVLASTSNKKYSHSSKNTVTKFFSTHDYGNQERIEDTNLKANNILKYYDKYLNLKSETQKTPVIQESKAFKTENLFFIKKKSLNTPPKNFMSETKNLGFQNDQEKQEKEMNFLKQELSKFNEKFTKMQETMESLIEKQLEMQKTLVVAKKDKENENNELLENEEDKFSNSKVYFKLEEFLSRLNEENEKIIEENNNLKILLENKINSLEEKIQSLTEYQPPKEDNLEKVQKSNYIFLINLFRELMK